MTKASRSDEFFSAYVLARDGPGPQRQDGRIYGIDRSVGDPVRVECRAQFSRVF